MRIIDEELLNEVSSEDKASPRLRINYNFHQSLEDKCHRMLNAVEPGTVVAIHRHPTKDESFVILRGKVRVTTHNDDGSIIEDVVLSQESGGYGVDIPKGVWHRVEALVFCSFMTQDEKWIAKYNEIMAFMAENHRRPSKYYLEERNNWNWMRHQQKLMGKGEMKEERIELFEKLLDLCGEYRRVNQYV